VTGVHPLSTLMRIEVYRMFEYDAETRMYRCFYTHDPGVDSMNFRNSILRPEILGRGQGGRVPREELPPPTVGLRRILYLSFICSLE
jgi:hypothetical protein